MVPLQVHGAEVALYGTDQCNLFVELVNGDLVFADILLVVELGETPLHHVLHPKLFHTQQIQDHGVGQPELGLQLGGRPLQYKAASSTDTCTSHFMRCE